MCARYCAKPRTSAVILPKNLVAFIMARPGNALFAAWPPHRNSRSWPKKASPSWPFPISWTTTTCNRARPTARNPCRRSPPVQTKKHPESWKTGQRSGCRAFSAAFGARLKRSGAAAVFASAGVDFDLVADVAEQGNRDFEAGRQLGRLHDLAGGVALDGRLGVLDGTHHRGGQFDGDRATIERSEEHTSQLQSREKLINLLTYINK